MNLLNSSWKTQETSDEREKEEGTAVSLLKDFCEDTSWGGLGRVVGSSFLFFRVIWFLAFVGAFGAGIYQLDGLFQIYRSKPISTRISLQRSAALTFPTVTVCNFNILRKSRLKDLPKAIQEDIEKYAKKPDINSEQSHSESSQKQPIDEDIPHPEDLDAEIKQAEMLESLLAEQEESVLKPLGHQFSDMILFCKFRGVDCKNSTKRNFWTSFWHYKYGNCFVFNPELIRGVKQPILNASKPGPSLGLTLEIDTEQFEYIDQITQHAGAVVQVSPRGDMPFPYEEGISLSPGFATTLGMRMVQLSRIDRFSNQSCVNQNSESSVNNNIYAQKFNTSYSTMACIHSCIGYNQKARCGCMEHKYYPKDRIICDTLNLTTVICLRKLYADSKANKLNCTTGCPPPCNEIVHRLTSSFSMWPSQGYMESFITKAESEKSFEEIRNNLLKLQIFYQELNYELIKEEISYLIENFLSDIGGMLGLWVGASVLSVLEVIELIFLLIIHFSCKKDSRKSQTNGGVSGINNLAMT